MIVIGINLSLSAQTPQAFNYQGVARTLTGQIIPGQNIGIRISLLEGTANGMEVYQEVHAVQTNNLGLFSIKVGEGTVVNGVFDQISWGNASHFLQIEIDENGGSDFELVGTSQLLSVPYALYAAKGGFWKENEEGIYYNDGSVGVGTNNLVEKLEVRVDGGNQGVRLANSGNAASDYTAVRFFQAETQKGVVYTNQDNIYLRGALPENDVIIQGHEIGYPQGNVGIGTTTPGAKLQIASGDIYIEDASRGVIMRSPNGQCWRMTVNNSGQPTFTAIACP